MSATVSSPVAADYLQYICHACGYVYNEADGDPDSGLAAGTRFADIPEDWYCPLCGVGKADFSLYVAPTLAALRAGVAGATGTAPVARKGHVAPGVVIVGAGRAGWQIAQALRAADAARPITIVTACAGDVYDKPMLSVAMARQLAPDKLVKETGAAAALRLKVRLMSHTHAIRICTDTRQLRTTKGNLGYDELVLAHGAHAALPAALPANLCWRVNHLGAYLQLRAALGSTPRDVLIVGAGLIGSELANDLALGGHHITLLDVQTEPLARWQTQQAGPQVLQAWKNLPINFVGKVQVAKVEKLGQRLRVTTECGQCFVVDQVIAAVGLQTPGRLARGAGLQWNNGIAVDPQTLRTSNAHIHALGDCITLNGEASRFIEPIARQAQTIAADLCGDAPVPFVARHATVRVKTTSLPLTLY